MPILVCVIQITLISSLTFAASHVCLSRSPRLAAQISWLGIVLSAMVAVATLVDAPRPWAIRGSSPNDLVSAPIELRSAEASMPSPASSAIDSSVTIPQGTHGLTAQRLLQSLTRMRRQYPIAETRVANGCWLVATANRSRRRSIPPRSVSISSPNGYGVSNAIFGFCFEQRSDQEDPNVEFSKAVP